MSDDFMSKIRTAYTSRQCLWKRARISLACPECAIRPPCRSSSDNVQVSVMAAVQPYLRHSIEVR